MKQWRTAVGEEHHRGTVWKQQQGHTATRQRKGAGSSSSSTSRSTAAVLGRSNHTGEDHHGRGRPGGDVVGWGRTCWWRYGAQRGARPGNRGRRSIEACRPEKQEGRNLAELWVREGGAEAHSSAGEERGRGAPGEEGKRRDARGRRSTADRARDGHGGEEAVEHGRSKEANERGGERSLARGKLELGRGDGWREEEDREGEGNRPGQGGGAGAARMRRRRGKVAGVELGEERLEDEIDGWLGTVRRMRAREEKERCGREEEKNKGKREEREKRKRRGILHKKRRWEGRFAKRRKERRVAVKMQGVGKEKSQGQD